MWRKGEHNDCFYISYVDVKAGIVKWPMSVIRLDCSNKERLTDLVDKILRVWRSCLPDELRLLKEWAKRLPEKKR